MVEIDKPFQIYQCYIMLRGINPPVWRRLPLHVHIPLFVIGDSALKVIAFLLSVCW